MPVGFRGFVTSKGNLFSTTVKGWNTLTFVLNSYFFRCDRVPTIYRMDSTTLMMKLFATKVSGSTIVTKSYILGKAGFKMNYYLIYSEAESSNAQFLCHFAFPFFKFWIIPSPSCNSFKCTRRFKQKTELHFFKILQCCF